MNQMLPIPRGTREFRQRQFEPSPGQPMATADPRRDIRAGLIVAFLFFVVLLGWAAIARLDAVAMANGKLAVSGQRQSVQHREGGIVQDILVREGQQVAAGQVLVRLAAADVRAQERSLTAQLISLLAQRARLEAEQGGQTVIAPPPEFALLTGADREDAILALRMQGNQLRTRLATLAAQRGVLGQRTGQASSSGRGYDSQIAASDRQLRLIDEELASLRTLADRGFVSRNRLRALERDKAELEGQRGQYRATVAQLGGQAQETRLQLLEAQSAHHEKLAGELRETAVALGDLRPRWDAARDQLARADIRAPATGVVMGLSVFTRGGVLAPGQRLMDIVPGAAPLTVEARIALSDADDIRPGMRALLRFDTLHERALPALDGRIVRLSADSFTDERSGETYFSAEVAISATELKKIDAFGGRDRLRAGIPVTVSIPLRSRTALEYLAEPLTGSLRGSLHEQ